MELYIDGQTKETPGTADETFGGVLTALSAELTAAGKAITTISLDGAEVMPEGDAALVARPAAELGRVDISTAPAAEWGRHGLGEVASAMGQLADECRAAADLLRKGDQADGLDKINGVLAAYVQVVQALVNSATLAAVKPPEDLEERISAVTSTMRELEPALRAKDGVAAADLAEYELAEELDKLGKTVKSMVE